MSVSGNNIVVLSNKKTLSFKDEFERHFKKSKNIEFFINRGELNISVTFKMENIKFKNNELYKISHIQWIERDTYDNILNLFSTSGESYAVYNITKNQWEKDCYLPNNMAEFQKGCYLSYICEEIFVNNPTRTY